MTPIFRTSTLHNVTLGHQPNGTHSHSHPPPDMHHYCSRASNDDYMPFLYILYASVGLLAISAIIVICHCGYNYMKLLCEARAFEEKKAANMEAPRNAPAPRQMSTVNTDGFTTVSLTGPGNRESLASSTASAVGTNMTVDEGSLYAIAKQPSSSDANLISGNRIALEDSKLFNVAECLKRQQRFIK
ncbi:hypothetical protein SEUCBS140593_004565 [Sporothrix eucalyptigena]|uniref:Uncharacterized protein n=1 Tax=Sporothrix eucalyptigena TaxID=1812306 RepID=A0ABP0BQH0_9PEZI